MARDILGEYGKDSPQPQAAPVRDGGKPEVKQLDYKHPVGPTSQMQQGPGLHGTNHGSSGTQGKR